MTLLTPTTTDVTELLDPGPRALSVRARPRFGHLWASDGPGVELFAGGAAVLVLLAAVVAGGPAARPHVGAAARLPVVVPAAPAVPAVAVRPAVISGRTPDVVGMQRDAAATALLAAGYRSVTWMVEPGHARPSGSVVRQEPGALSAVPARATARLIIAR